MQTPNRRAFIIGATSVIAGTAFPVLANTLPSMHVLKDPGCGCCGSWIEILRADGFDVSVENTSWETLNRFKLSNGLPENMTSCHTGKIADYLIEGHVPTADIRRLLSVRPRAIGLAVPGMPYGSPGMGPESEREAYDVFLIRQDGSAEIFSSYAAA